MTLGQQMFAFKHQFSLWNHTGKTSYLEMAASFGLNSFYGGKGKKSGGENVSLNSTVNTSFGSVGLSDSVLNQVEGENGLSTSALNEVAVENVLNDSALNVENVSFNQVEGKK